MTDIVQRWACRLDMSKFQKVIDTLPKYSADAILLTGKPNLRYVSGFDSSGSMALITRRGAYFFADGRYIEEAEKKINDADVRLIPAGKSAADVLGPVIKNEEVTRLGFEEDRVTVLSYNKWKTELDCDLIPAGRLMSELRAVKERREIDALIDAQRLTERVYADVLEYVRQGRTEREISSFIQYRTLLYGAEKMSFDPIIVSGPNSSLPHGKPTDRRIEAGDFLTMDFGCVLGGYCSDMTRTVAVGYMTGEMEEVYDVVLSAQLEGIRTAKAGVTGRSIHEAAAGVITQAGYGKYFTHGFGHGIGIEDHEEPMASLSNNAPLPENAVISAEPGIYLPGRFGVRIEDSIVIGRDQSVSLMKAPKDKVICQIQ